MKFNWAVRHPFQTAAYLIWRRVQRYRHQRQFKLDQIFPTFNTDLRVELGAPVFNYASVTEAESTVWDHLAKNYLAHRFDLLGSGWTHVHLGLQAAGLEGQVFQAAGSAVIDPQGNWLKSQIPLPYLSRAKKLWQMVSPNYQPLDWQIDFKSGYRWSAQEWHQQVSITPQRGADIKVPWELARGHHLPQLAMAYAGRPFPALALEFCDQVLDFIVQNPPRFGVNWRCSMDIGIRAVNWIIAFDIFQAANFKFSPEFLRVFAQSLFAHGQYIWNHLEWHPVVRGNHYLANMAGLIFISARLRPTPEIDRWLKFSLLAWQGEIRRQFLPDGANFEGSTSYHRLSAEMVAYVAGIVSSLEPSRRDPALHLESIYPRLMKMAEFTQRMTKNSGRIGQIGDNDSGRFLKLDSGVYQLPEGREEFLDHRPLVSLINGFVHRREWDAFAGVQTFARRWLESKQIQYVSRTIESSTLNVKPQITWESLQLKFQGCPESSRQTKTFSWPQKLDLSQMSIYSFPNFGAYVLRADSFCLIVRCGSTIWDGSGGHLHNDQLSCELEIAGRDIISDPGTYLYTPIPELRNLYRSTKAHFTPTLKNEEQADLNQGLFALTGRARAECLIFEPTRFAGWHRALSQPIYRLIEISAIDLKIQDFTTGPKPLIVELPTLEFSNGYGQLQSDRNSA